MSDAAGPGGHRTDRPDLANYATTRRAGPFLFVAGVSGRRADGVVPGRRDTSTGTHNDAAIQAEHAFENLDHTLRSAGFTASELVSVTCYLVDANDYPALVSSWNDYFAHGDPPARTTLVVRQLPDPDLRVELTAVAYQGG